MLEIRNLKKTFNRGMENEQRIFDGLNLSIAQGTINALIGANGCGKSTLMNLISGSLSADEGSISLGGEDITRLKEFQRAERIAKVYQNPSAGVAPSLTVYENMLLAEKKGERFRARRLADRRKREYFAALLNPLLPDFGNKLDIRANLLSGGQRQALSLVLSTLKRPELLLLDEHTAALDPKTSRLIMEKTIAIAKEQRITTLMISHNLKDALKYSDRLIMLRKGRIVLDLAPSETDEAELLKIFYRTEGAEEQTSFEM